MALNPEIRRRLNDHRRGLFQDTVGEIAFLCECADGDCVRSVVLTADRFDELREQAQILLHAGHEALAVDALPGLTAADDAVHADAVPVDLLEVDRSEADPLNLDALQLESLEVALLDVDPPGPEPVQ
jgi:hypothetical protein